MASSSHVEDNFQKSNVAAQTAYPYPSDETPASQLWAVYVSEAAKYDKSLVESWKNDMEGMLIFAGLFSASLTAFIIESYKTLTPDSGDSTVQLLTHISQQLAAAANGTAFPAQSPAPFTPLPSSLICNALWFMSLGLSLTCALIATLLEQWARDFLHRADIHSSPVIRARIFSYLYYGLKRFNMHVVVDIIPLLLHASLVFFFAGLVAFLFPVNSAIAAVAAAPLVIVVVVYSALTLLPLWFLDCPYRTPLSTAVWRVLGIIATIWCRRPKSPSVASTSYGSWSSATMVEAMSRQATKESPGRVARDYRALVWTVKSLADDIELEPFVEGLPDVLWGPLYKRYGYEDHIQKLIRTPELQLQSRIEALLRSCDSGLLSPDASRRRRITCLKALWAIGSVQPPVSSDHSESLDFARTLDYCRRRREGPEILHYSTSAVALMRWSTFCSVKTRFAGVVDSITQWRANAEGGHVLDLTNIITFLESQPFPFHISATLRDNLSGLPVSFLDIIPELTHTIDEFCIRTPYRILFDYLRESAMLKSRPYQWHIMRPSNMRPSNPHGILSVDHSAPLSAFSDLLEGALGQVIFDHYVRRPPMLFVTDEDDWVDLIVQILCSFWRPQKPVPIPLSIILYLNYRNSNTALENFLVSTPISRPLWSCFAITISHGPSTPQLAPALHLPDEVKTALWCLASMTAAKGTTYSPAVYEPILDAFKSISSDFSPVEFSVVAITKSQLVGSLSYSRQPLDRAQMFRHSSLPTETAISTPALILDDSPELFPDSPDRVL
ncbi:hypothetical protein MVEN_01353800 [Mycena venus]|uniref:DUF6535 domain-containing protein n=1 Tax=Mycena venus TaxID=2733690 RepID=A0A8H6Y281_9AGAR|nr:hypothetical protein MVEN_01353800 [Mycena venus]